MVHYTLPNAHYYSEKVHRADFVLPEFVRSFLENGISIAVFERAAAAAKSKVAAEGKKKRNILLGSIARPLTCAEYVACDPSK
jgi:hypothetical protein